MGETVITFNGKRADIRPENASRIGSGYRETRDDGAKLFVTFDEAMADAVGYMFTA